MRLKILIYLALSATLAYGNVPWAEGRSRGEDLQIKLVTFSPGDDITTYFGHTALVVQDARRDTSRYYNFGLFAFEKDFILNFVKGRLIFWAGDGRVGPSLLRYAQEGRDIIVQDLALSPRKKLEVARMLTWWVLPGNNSYLYHHYLNNCSTIPRDILDFAVDGQLAAATKIPSGKTFRDYTKQYTAREPLLMLLLMFLMNDSIDKPVTQWDGMFLPDELMKRIGQLVLTDSTGARYDFVTSEQVYHKSHRKPVPDSVPSYFWPTLLAGILWGGLAVAFAMGLVKQVRLSKTGFALLNILTGLILGIPGLGLTLISLFTDHQVTYYNENLFLANPVTFCIAFIAMVWLFQKKPYSKLLYASWAILSVSALMLLLLKLLPLFDQNNHLEMALILPVNLEFFAGHFMIRRWSIMQGGTGLP